MSGFTAIYDNDILWSGAFTGKQCWLQIDHDHIHYISIFNFMYMYYMHTTLFMSAILR